MVAVPRPGSVGDGVTFGVLGPFQVLAGGRWQAAPTRQVARVGTILAGWPGEPVERDRIIAGVWADQAPKTATNTLQAYVSHLRRLVGPGVIRSSGTAYVLDVAPEAIDAGRFTELVQDAGRLRRHGHMGRAAELLAAGLALWRGEPFPDIADVDLVARRARLVELRDQAREDLLECRLELCADAISLGELIADAKELVGRQPLREKGHMILVRALAAADRPGEASVAFAEAAAQLRDRHGLDPGQRLVDVYARSLTHDPAILPRAMRRPLARVPATAGDPRWSAAAQRVRELVVDAGARLVTVLAGPDDRDLAASVVVAALDADMAEGAQRRDELPMMLGPFAAAVVTGPVTAAQIEQARGSWAGAVVIISAAPLGIDFEVVVDAATGGTATVAGSGTPEHRRGA